MYSYQCLLQYRRAHFQLTFQVHLEATYVKFRQMKLEYLGRKLMIDHKITEAAVSVFNIDLTGGSTGLIGGFLHRLRALPWMGTTGQSFTTPV